MAAWTIAVALTNQAERAEVLEKLAAQLAAITLIAATRRPA
jgi:hypothetical protein